MKRWVIAVVVLWAGVASIADADYVKIIINVGGSPDKGATAGQTPPAGGEVGGGAGGIGIAGAGAGGGIGIAGAGAGGGRGIPGGGGRFPGLGGAGGGGSPDDPRGGTPGGGDSGGGAGLVGLGGGSVGTGVPPRGGLTGEGAGGQGIGSLGEGLFTGELDSRSIWVEAVIEFEGKDGVASTNVPMYGIKHHYVKGGKTWFPTPPGQNVRVVRQGGITAYIHPDYRLIHIKGLTVAQRYELKQKELAKSKQEGNVAALVELSMWCLQHGLVDEVPKHMAKAAKAEPKNPLVNLFQKVEEAVRRDPQPGDDGDIWRERLGNLKVLDSTRHYRILYEDSEPLARRLYQRLETNFRAFYYWWALRGHLLPVPEKRLVAILVEEQKSFDYQHRNIFDSPPLAADGFLARRENVAIISATRQDASYDALAKFAKPFQMHYAKADLLTGKGFTPKTRNVMETSYAQMLTLLQEALQDESELMTATHEGTRQLIAAVGILPRNVDAPLWIDSGMGSFFETPKGAFWPGTGAPNWAHLATWKQMEKDKKVAKPDEALKAVVTDRYFRDAVEMAVKEKEARDNPPKDRPAENEKDKDTADKAMARARAQSWGLTYFATLHKMQHLQRYYQELQRLPRDLPIDEDTLWVTFARSFELMKAGSTQEIDTGKVHTFGAEWQRYIRQMPLPAAELQKDITKDKDGKPIGG